MFLLIKTLLHKLSCVQAYVTICWFRPTNAHPAVVAINTISLHVIKPLY